MLSDDMPGRTGELQALKNGISGRISTVPVVCPFEGEHIPPAPNAAVLQLRNRGNARVDVSDGGFGKGVHTVGVFAQAEGTQMPDRRGSELLAPRI
jgi:hypothetical protein